MSKEKITTIVFDLGGVLVDWDPRYLYRKLMPEEEMEWFLANVCTKEWNDLQDGGRTFSEAIRVAAEAHPKYGNLIEAYFDRWEEMLAGEISGTVEILENLREQNFKILALSNWSHETFAIAERRFPFLQLFDGKIVSGFEKVKKPDPKIFHLLCERYTVKPREAIFIDDVEKNILAAQALGFHTVHFQGPQDLEEKLAAVRIL